MGRRVRVCPCVAAGVRAWQVQAGIASIDLVSPRYRDDMNEFHAFASRAIEEEVRGPPFCVSV
jgi:hypothetical protein